MLSMIRHVIAIRERPLPPQRDARGADQGRDADDDRGHGRRTCGVVVRRDHGRTITRSPIPRIASNPVRDLYPGFIVLLLS
jgi:hypothetical protein